MKVLGAVLLACVVAALPAPRALKNEVQAPLSQDAYLLVITGVEGDAQHGEMFHRWATGLIDVVMQKYGVPESRISYLAEKPDRDSRRISGRSTRENVERVFKEMAERARPDDDVFIVLFGHGSFDGSESRFNLPGPDLTATDYAALLDRFRAKVVFVNTSSSSGGFVPALSGPRRTIITATRTGGERNETRFPEFFVEAFTSDAADVDKDGRVSMLEAFNDARGRVARAYEQAGLLLTEHALLDDNGDQKGATEPGPATSQGKRAAFQFFGFPVESRPASGAAATDPVLRGLYAEREDLQRRLDALRQAKETTDPARYEQELEKLLTEMAVKSRAIREREAKK